MQVFSYWKVLESEGSEYLCLCTGCNKTQRLIRKWNLLAGKTKSCGCKKIDLIKETNNQRYGCNFPQQNEGVREKTIAVLEEKYEVDNYMKTEECKEKIREVNNKKYGVDHHTKSEKWKNRNKVYGNLVLGKKKPSE